ncbi:MAG: MoaD/ThiS family protein [Nitrososphaeraceae archaeon]
MDSMEGKKLIKIKLFGVLRENMNSKYLILYINNDAITIRELKKRVNKLYPSLNLNNKVVFTFNKRICYKENIVVNHDDEISILPPISGG